MVIWSSILGIVGSVVASPVAYENNENF